MFWEKVRLEYTFSSLLTTINDKNLAIEKRLYLRSRFYILQCKNKPEQKIKSHYWNARSLEVSIRRSPFNQLNPFEGYSFVKWASQRLF